MSDEVMMNLLALLQNTMDGNRMAEGRAQEIMEGIAAGIREDTIKMQRAVFRMEGVLKELAVLLGESVILMPENVLEQTVRTVAAKEERKTGKPEMAGMPGKSETTEQVKQMQAEEERVSYPVAFFYRSKVNGTHGSESFYLVIDETEDELVYYLYDQNQKLVNSGKTDDKSLPVSAIEEMALNREVLDQYSCYRMRPELIEVHIKAPAPEEKKTEMPEKLQTEQEHTAEKEALLETEAEKSAAKEQREKAKIH